MIVFEPTSLRYFYPYIRIRILLVPWKILQIPWRTIPRRLVP